MGIRLGQDALLDRNSASYGSPSWANIEIARDVTKNDTMQEADASIRNAGAGFSFKEPTIRELGFDFEMVVDIGHTDYVALRTAYLARTMVEFRVVTATASGNYYTRAECKMFSWTQSEALGDILKVQVSAKPCYSTNAIVDGTL